MPRQGEDNRGGQPLGDLRDRATENLQACDQARAQARRCGGVCRRAQGGHFHFSICQLLHVLKDVFSLFNLLVVTCTQRSLYTFTFFSFRCAPGRRATLGRSRSQSSRNGATSPPRSLASNKTRKIQEMFESQCGKVESQKVLTLVKENCFC